MKRVNSFLALLALILIAGAGIGEAWAYFTTYAEAWGGKVIRLGDETEITETFSAETRHIRIANEEESQPVYIRVKVFAGADYMPEGSGEGWSGKEADEFYYYQNPVEGGGFTEDLLLKIPFDREPEADRPFNVIVVYESTPVKYDAEGNPVGYNNVDWSETLDRDEIEAPVTLTEGGGEG